MRSASARTTTADLVRRNSEKAQLQDFTERFGNYIRNVKAMRNQMKQADGLSAARRLEEEVTAMRSTYEQEISKLQEQLGHTNQTQHGLSHRSDLMATEYQDRLWEMDRDLQKKDEEIEALQLLVAQKESDIQTLKGAAISPSLQLDLAKQELEELRRSIKQAQEGIDSFQPADMEKSSVIGGGWNVTIFGEEQKKIDRLRYEEEFSQRIKLQDQVQELTIYIEDLKENDKKEIQEMRDRTAQSEALVLQLQDKLRTASRGGPALMETVQKIQEASEAEVKRLQNETEAVYNQSFLELQMRLNNDQVVLGRAQEEKQQLHQRVEELTSEVTRLEKKLVSEDANNRTVIERLQVEHVRERHHRRVLEARLEELQDILLAKMKELSAFQASNLSLRNELDTLKSMLLEEEKQMSSAVVHFPWIPPTDSFHSSGQNLTPEYSRSSLLGSPGTLYMGTTADSSKLVTSTNSTGISLNSEKNIDDFEQYTRPATAPSFNLQTRDQGQQSPDTMKESLHPKQSEKRMSSTDSDHRPAIASALGDLEISELDPAGHFVRISNKSPDKEEDIGGFILQQNVHGHPVSLYRFPPKTRILPNTPVTVWASAANVQHRPPVDFLWKDQKTFLTEPQCTTILCTASGHAVAWYTPVHEKGAKSRERYEVCPTAHKIPPPVLIQTEKQRDEERELGGESGKHVLEEVSGDQREPQTPLLLRREKISPSVLSPTSSPWTHSAAVPTHPDFSPGPGHDGRSLCPQSRSLRTNSEPTSGTSGGRNPSTNHRIRTGRGPTRSAGPNSRGVLYLGRSSPAGSVLHKFISNSSYDIRLASQVSLTPTALSNV